MISGKLILCYRSYWYLVVLAVLKGKPIIFQGEGVIGFGLLIVVQPDKLFQRFRGVCCADLPDKPIFFNRIFDRKFLYRVTSW